MDLLVHTADTITLTGFDVQETIVSPPGTPLVHDLELGTVRLLNHLVSIFAAVSVKVDILTVLSAFWVVLFPSPSAVSDCTSLGSGLWTRSVASNSESVVEVRRAPAFVVIDGS